MNRLSSPGATRAKGVTRIAGTAAVATALVAGLAGFATTAHAEGMSVSSSAFKDGGLLPAEYAGANECGGKNTSPPLEWKNLPQATHSVVIKMTDPDGAKGGGVVHWIAYNVPASVTSLAAGAGNKSGDNITVGKNISGAEAYRGACPPVGDTPHHYIITVTATDIAPGSLPPGLDAAGLTVALAGHTLNGSTIVARYGR